MPLLQFEISELLSFGVESGLVNMKECKVFGAYPAETYGGSKAQNRKNFGCENGRKDCLAVYHAVTKTHRTWKSTPRVKDLDRR